MTNTETGSPTSRLQGARKQLALARDSLDDETVIVHVDAAVATVQHALDRLNADPAWESTASQLGPELVECVGCGKVGLPERIHRTACPHDGELGATATGPGGGDR